MYNEKNKKPRFNFNPQKQQGGFKPQPIFGQPRKQQSPFQGRQPQQPQSIQPIPAQPTNDLQNKVFALQQEIETLKQISVDSNKQIIDLQNQVVKIIEYLNQPD